MRCKIIKDASSSREIGYEYRLSTLSITYPAHRRYEQRTSGMLCVSEIPDESLKPLFGTRFTVTDRKTIDLQPKQEFTEEA